MRTSSYLGVAALAAGSIVASAQSGLLVNPSVEGLTTGSAARAPLVESLGPAALPEDFEKLRLTPGTTLSFSVFDAPEMNFALQVDNLGDVLVPLAGKIHVGEQTLPEAEDSIARVLMTLNMFIKPVVSLKLTGYLPHYVTVSGDVQTPGKVSLLTPRPLLDVLAVAGGETSTAGADVEITHRNESGVGQVTHVTYAAGLNPSAAERAMVAPGDSVYVRRAGIIYVLGSVTRPGGYLMVNNGAMTLSQAIAYAQGTTQLASIKNAYIARRQGDHIAQIQVPLKSTEKGQTDSVALSDGDVVFVPTNGLKDVLLTVGGLASTLGSAVIYTTR